MFLILERRRSGNGFLRRLMGQKKWLRNSMVKDYMKKKKHH